MKTIANIIWFIFTGIWSAISYAFLGLIYCITIIGIPFGKVCFRMAHLVIAPFGKEVVLNFSKHPIANVIWLVFFGWGNALFFLFEGLIYCLTIIGIPCGLQCFKMAKLSLIPFGAEIK